MTKTLERLIEDLLEDANGANGKNVLPLADARTFIGDFLVDLDAEFDHFPEEREIAQWNLAAADYAPDEPVAILFAILEDGMLTVLAGQGEPGAHFDFGEDEELPEDAAGIEAAARSGFRMGEVALRVEVADARAWAMPD